MSAHILLFVFPISNVSFMASHWCHCHVLHPFYWRPSCSHVAATVEAPSECGQFVAIKYEVNGRGVHHPQAPAHRIGVHMGTCERSDAPKESTDAVVLVSADTEVVALKGLGTE